MAVLNTVRPVSATPIKGVFVQMITSVVASLAEWNDARKTKKALSALSSRQLDDIGLCYGDIESIARR